MATAIRRFVLEEKQTVLGRNTYYEIAVMSEAVGAIPKLLHHMHRARTREQCIEALTSLGFEIHEDPPALALLEMPPAPEPS